MNIKRTTLITFETSETLIFRRAAETLRAWCDGCEAEVEMIKPELGAQINGTSARMLYRLIESGQVHFIETRQGSTWVCMNSLAQIKEWEDRQDV